MPEGYLGISTNPTVNMLDRMMHEWNQRQDEEGNKRKPKYLFDAGRDTTKALSSWSRKSRKSFRYSDNLY